MGKFWLYRRGAPAFAALATATVVLTLGAPASAATATDVQANQPQIAGDPTSNTTARFPTNKQNEPTIAANPASANLIAGSNDEQQQPACGAPIRQSDPTDCSFFPGVGTDGVYTSANGGTSWTNRGLLDDFAGWQASPFVSDGDPVIVYGPRYDPATRTFSTTAYDAYYQSLASYKPGRQPGNQIPEFIVVSRSSNDGVSWTGPSVIVNAHGVTFNDKNAIWADKNPTSPYFGRLYSSWTQFRGIPGAAEPVMTSYSADGGRTWSRPNQLSRAENFGTAGGRQGSAARTDGHGNVYIAWEDGSNQVYAVSTDGGVTYTHAKAIGPVADLVDPIPGSNFRNDSFLSLASDPRANSTTLYAAWVNRTNTAGSVAEVVVYRTSGAGWSKVATPYSGSVTGSGIPFFQGLDVSGDGRVDLGWQGMTAVNPAIFGTGNAAIDAYYASSPAGGTAFTGPTKVTAVSSDPAASAQNNLQRQFWGDYNTLVSKGNTAWFIYTDARHGVGCPAVDAYQTFLVTSGAVIEQEEREAAREKGKAGPEDGDKPAPPTDCPAQFGNTDAFVSVITP
ncbi:MAG: glycoside hydrolase [Actinomycetota bacterium]|nr:glycoside hydrolase [Actinomycetota bacterium]